MKSKYIIIQILLSLLLLGSAGTLFGVHYYLTSKKVDNSATEKEEKLKRFSTSSRRGTYLEARNVYFRFKKNISLELPFLHAELVPKGNLSILNFDDVNSFIINIKKGEAFASKEVLEVIFKENVFNFEGSPLKIGNLEIPPQSIGENKIKLTGEIDFLIWLEFEMEGKVSLDPANNTIVITAEKVTALGNSYAKTLLGAVGLNLEKLLPLPKDRGILMKENQIIVYPFQIFPPPAMAGDIAAVGIKDGKLHLTLGTGEKLNLPKPPVPNATNYLYLHKGDVKFGKLFMVDANLQMIDKDPSDYLDFYMEDYFRTLTIGGTALVLPDQSLKVIMPDYGDLFK
jgi:hypothetical protein